MKINKTTGYVLHRGVVNGEPFAAIATLKTKNAKTGDMVQIWFLLENHNPIDAVKLGIDGDTICRGCPFAGGKGCYVSVHQAPLSVWKAFHRGRYPVLNPVGYAGVFGDRKVRFGAYGNPSLLPIAMVKAIAAVSQGWTGYFHDWREKPEYTRYFMASTETADSFKLARSLGYRVFHASPIQPDKAIECLSETKGMTCADCKLCAGLSKSRLPSVWINPHGKNKGAAIAIASGNN